MNVRELRRVWSAAKARGYQQDHGRGILTTIIASMDTPIAGWMAENTGMHTYENRFYTLDDLKKEGAPGYVVAMVEGYDPDSQVIVAIEYDPGVDAEPEIIELKDLPI